MLSQTYYLVRSRQDGQYLVVRPRLKSEPTDSKQPPEQGFLLMFSEHADALSYLNTHGGQVADRFSVESIPSTQVGSLLKRWGFSGIGVVQDPLIPHIEFLRQQ